MSDDIEEVPDEVNRGVQGRDGVQGIQGPPGVPGTAATPEAIARALELKAALAENTETLAETKKSLDRVRRRQFITWGALLGLIIAYAFAGVLYLELRDAQRDLKVAQADINAGQVQACESGNSVRQGLLEMAAVFEASLSEPRADGRPRTEREVEQIVDFVAGLRESFALRDCGS